MNTFPHSAQANQPIVRCQFRPDGGEKTSKFDPIEKKGSYSTWQTGTVLPPFAKPILILLHRPLTDMVHKIVLGATSHQYLANRILVKGLHKHARSHKYNQVVPAKSFQRTNAQTRSQVQKIMLKDELQGHTIISNIIKIRLVNLKISSEDVPNPGHVFKK